MPPEVFACFVVNNTVTYSKGKPGRKPVMELWERMSMRVIRVRQEFDRPKVDNIRERVRREFAKLGLEEVFSPGTRVAVTAGSRGIANIVTVLSEVVTLVREAGGEPFLVSSMGSHGGGTVEGQKEVLNHLGITEEAVGTEIVVTDEAVVVGSAPGDQVVYCDPVAARADAILVVNRVKLHTSFRGELESGLFKMMVVGLGKEPGASSFHALGHDELASSLVKMGRVFLERLPVVGGLAIIENGYEETAAIHGLRPDEMEEEEKKLQARAKELLPRLPVNELDLLVVDEIGKNISGTGMDSNVIGRRRLDGGPDFYPPKIKRIVVLGLSEATGANGYGLGLADFTTRRVVEKLDRTKMNVNALASGFPPKAFIPITLENDRAAVETAAKSLDGRVNRVARIRNTLELDELELAPTLLEKLRADADCVPVGEPYDWQFTEEGRLPPLEFDGVGR
jgi:uncharacterized protein (DUF362 family)